MVKLFKSEHSAYLHLDIYEAHLMKVLQECYIILLVIISSHNIIYNHAGQGRLQRPETGTPQQITVTVLKFITHLQKNTSTV